MSSGLWILCYLLRGFPEHSARFQKKLGCLSHMVESQDTSPSLQGTTGHLPPKGAQMRLHKSKTKTLKKLPPNKQFLHLLRELTKHCYIPKGVSNLHHLHHMIRNLPKLHIRVSNNCELYARASRIFYACPGDCGFFAIYPTISRPFSMFPK